jgi:AAA+ superfamily predicted ATPase
MKNRIINYIKAGYPGLFVLSHEETRVEAAMRDVVDALNSKIGQSDDPFQLCAWSCSEGVVNVSREGQKISDTEDPISMLNAFLAADDRTIYLLRDFHLFTEDRNPLVWRKLRDCLAQAKSRTKAIVILGCRLTLPPELEKEVTVIDFTLPDREQLRVILRGLLESNGHAPLEDEAQVLAAATGLTTIEAENAFALSIIETGSVCPKIVYREKVAAVKKGGLLEVMDSKLTLDDVGGLQALKAWLIEKKDHFTDAAREYNLPMPRGIMMVGQPGCGKTETAKACGAVFGLPILKLDAGKLFGSLVGQSEQNWRAVHATAKAMAPCILFIDEIDGIGGTGSNMDSGVTDRVVKSILQAMDEKVGIFYIGTANDIDKIKTPILRRFDEVWNVELPAQPEREAILSIQLSRVKRDPAKFNLKEVATAMHEFSGAEIEKIVTGALSRAFADGRREPTTADLMFIASDFAPLSRTAADDIAKRRERLKGVAKLASGPLVTATATTKSPVKRKLAAFPG